jgi:L-alanine-DL-glutamate epimerase-like enolase superfamily enzyme
LSKPLMPRAPHGLLAAAAALHVAASVLTAGPAVDWSGAAPGGVYGSLPEIQDGFLRVPQAPGLGVTVNADRLAKESGA